MSLSLNNEKVPSPSNQSSDERDRRWRNGMDGWRVSLYDSMGELPSGAQGEVTGYLHDGCFIYVVFDGEEEPRQLRWNQVRPA
jgi:hypothetical protein